MEYPKNWILKYYRYRCFIKEEDRTSSKLFEQSSSLHEEHKIRPKNYLILFHQFPIVTKNEKDKTNRDEDKSQSLLA